MKVMRERCDHARTCGDCFSEEVIADREKRIATALAMLDKLRIDHEPDMRRWSEVSAHNARVDALAAVLRS